MAKKPTRAERSAANKAAFAREKELEAEARRLRREALIAPIPHCKANEARFKYTPELADEICARVMAGQTIPQIAKLEHMPSYVTIYRWLNTYEGFAKEHAKALELSSHADAALMQETRNAVIRGDIEPDVGRVAMHASEWLASKRNAKMYGDKPAGFEGQGAQPVLNLNLTVKKE